MMNGIILFTNKINQICAAAKTAAPDLVIAGRWKRLGFYIPAP